MKNKITTSEGNICFHFPDGKEFNVSPNRVAWEINGDTINFIIVGLPINSGHAIMSSRVQDLEFNGTTYSSMSSLDAAVEQAMVEAGAVARYQVVEELPTTGQSNTIYLVPKEEGEGFDEYIYVDDEWDQIGDTEIDLSGYVTTGDLQTYKEEVEDDFEVLSGAIEGIEEVMVTDQEFADKLGSAFTGANSGVTVTEAIENVEVDLTDYYTKEEVDAKLEKPSVSGHTIVFPAAGASVNNHTIRIL